MVNTLLKRANNIPSTNKGRREETQQVKAVLRDNNYAMSFIQNITDEGLSISRNVWLETKSQWQTISIELFHMVIHTYRCTVGTCNMLYNLAIF